MGEGGDNERPRQFFIDVEELPGRSNEELFRDSENAETYFALFGRELVSKPLHQSAEMSVYHVSAKPGETVQPHRHGTHQMNYVLRGELFFGKRRVGAGMGFFTPDMLYAWRAGDEGAEWIEIHSGRPNIYTEQREL